MWAGMAGVGCMLPATNGLSPGDLDDTLNGTDTTLGMAAWTTAQTLFNPGIEVGNPAGLILVVAPLIWKLAKRAYHLSREWTPWSRTAQLSPEEDSAAPHHRPRNPCPLEGPSMIFTPHKWFAPSRTTRGKEGPRGNRGRATQQHGAPPQDGLQSSWEAAMSKLQGMVQLLPLARELEASLCEKVAQLKNCQLITEGDVTRQAEEWHRTACQSQELPGSVLSCQA